MKKVLLFSLLAIAVVFSAKGMLSNNQVIVEEPVLLMETPEDDMGCDWCISHGGGLYCGSAATCKEAKRIARDLAQM